MVVSRRTSGRRGKSKRNLLDQSTLSEDPYRNKKIHERFTSGNRNVEKSDSSCHNSESLSSDDQDDMFEGLNNIGFDEIREPGVQIPKDLIVYTEEYLRAVE